MHGLCKQVSHDQLKYHLDLNSREHDNKPMSLPWQDTLACNLCTPASGELQSALMQHILHDGIEFVIITRRYRKVGDAGLAKWLDMFSACTLHLEDALQGLSA